MLRDLTERVVIASKGRFDRAVPSKDRARAGLPWEASVTRDDFMEATLDMWEISPESATRVGHPAPFPVELPARLIELYTYRGDLVLDPFVGSGSTAVAALRTGRHYVGYDVDENYVRLAERRLARQGDRAKQRRSGLATPSPARVVRSGGKDWAQAISEGRTAKEVAHAALAAAGFRDVAEAKRTVGGVEVSFTALDDEGTLWMFGLFGRNTSHGSELARPGAIWEVLGKASVLRELTTSPFVLLTSGAPLRGGAAAGGLERLTGPGKAVHAVVDILSPSAARALQGLCSGRRART